MKTCAVTPVHSTLPEAMCGKGRIFSFDPRDRRHPMALPPRKPSRRAREWAPHLLPLDQGQTPMCVGFSTTQLLMAGPVVNRVAEPEAFARKLYALAQANDEWEGTDYDGTSARGAMKALQATGAISGYTWALDAATAALFILSTGPVLFGTDWLSEMEEPDEHGFIHAEGDSAGGHEYVALGVNLNKVCPDGSVGAFRLLNTWGEEWGERGRCWLSMKNADYLIKNNGDCCAPTEVRVKQLAL